MLRVVRQAFVLEDSPVSLIFDAADKQAVNGWTASLAAGQERDASSVVRSLFRVKEGRGGLAHVEIRLPL